MVSDNPLVNDEYADLEDADEFDNPDPHLVQPDHPDPLELLREHRQPAPQWLEPETRCSRALLKQFLSSNRISFYPGAGNDGQLFSVFGKSGSLHCHVHADFNVPATAVFSDLESAGNSRVYGYDVISHKYVSPSWLTPFEQPLECNWESRLKAGLIAVLQRQDRFDEDHGPEFQCLLHVQVDAYWLYWNLWAKHGRAPFAVVLQDHGFAGNPGKFGGEGQLFQMASQAGFPKFLLVGKKTRSWPGYAVVAGWAPGTGQHNSRRCLYGKVEADNTNSVDAGIGD